jgi:hypothetical protein
MRHALETLRLEALRIYRALPVDEPDTAELRASMLASLHEHYEAIGFLEVHLKPPLVPTEVVSVDRSKKLREEDRKTDFDYELFSDPKPIRVAPMTFKERFERTPDGDINNCSMAFGEGPEGCQICNGSCPDRARFLKSDITEKGI